MNKTRPPIPHGPPPPSPADEGLSTSYFLPAQPSAAQRSRQAKIKMEDFLKHSKVLMLCFVLLCFDRS